MPLEKSFEIELVSGHDQPIQFDPTPVLDGIEAAINRSIEEKDIDIAIQTGLSIYKTARMAGLGLAKLLWMINKHWIEYNIDEEFTDYIFTEMGISKTTIHRYVRIWDMWEDPELKLSATDKLKLFSRPIKDLSAIATTIDAGYPVNNQQWQSLIEAESNNKLLEVLRDAKNEEPRRQSIIISLKRDGSLVAYNSGNQYFLGYLETDKMEEEVVIKRAITRLVNVAGIMVE